MAPQLLAPIHYAAASAPPAAVGDICRLSVSSRLGLTAIVGARSVHKEKFYRQLDLAGWRKSSICPVLGDVAMSNAIALEAIHGAGHSRDQNR